MSENRVTVEEVKETRRVFEIFSDKNNWCSGFYAKSEEQGKNGWVLPNSPKATKWCLGGAIQRVYPKNYKEVIDSVMALIYSEEEGKPENEKFRGSIYNWNDKVGYNKVFNLCEKLAI